MVTKGSLWSIILILLLIFLLGSALRLYQLDHESIWVDEGFTYHYVSVSFDELITILSEIDVHPILFYSLERLWVNQFGLSEFSLRFLPFLFGSLSILSMFFFARELFSSRVALLSSLFLSASFIHVFYSQEAKMYSMLLFLMLSALFFLVRFVKKPSLSNVLLLGLSNGLLLHTHILSIPLILAQVFLYCFVSFVFKKHGIDLLWEMFGKKGKYNLPLFRVGVAFSLLLFLPWLPIAASQLGRVFDMVLRQKFIYKLGFDGFYYFFSATILAGLLVLWGFIRMAHKKEMLQKLFVKDKTPQWFTVTSFIFWLSWTLIVHKTFFSNTPLTRYSNLALPFLYLFFAKKLFDLENRQLFSILLGLYLVVTSFVFANYYTMDAKEQWREAVNHVESSIDGNDNGLIFHTAGHTWWAFHYYYKGNGSELKLHNKEDVAKIENFAAGKEKVYLILSHNFRTKDYFPRVIGEKFELVELKEFNNIKVYQYAVK